VVRLCLLLELATVLVDHGPGKVWMRLHRFTCRLSSVDALTSLNP
jgi:hypothetical protein